MAKPQAPSTNPVVNTRKQWSHKGYPKLADAYMGRYQTAAIFRRFGFLTTLNLMSLQAELVNLEHRLRTAIERDDTSADAKRDCLSTDFYELRAATPPNDKQRELLKASREKLKEYHELLLQAADVASLPKPAKHSLRNLREWLDSATGGDSFLQGLELDDTWDPDLDYDLVALASIDTEAGQETFLKWLNPTLVDWYHRIWAGRRKSRLAASGGVVDYTRSRFVRSIDGILLLVLTTIASLLPVAAILALYFIHRTVVRIYVTIGMTALLGLLLKYGTNANMKEVFGATAAFAAVEVVFIGSANGKP